MQNRNILYNYLASTYMKPYKVYLETTTGDIKQHFYNHKKYFNFAITNLTVENVSKNHLQPPRDVLEDWFP